VQKMGVQLVPLTEMRSDQSWASAKVNETAKRTETGLGSLLEGEWDLLMVQLWVRGLVLLTGQSWVLYLVKRSAAL